MQNSTEAATETARAGFDTAMKLGTQTTELYRTCVSLQTEGASQMLDESIRISKVLLGDSDPRNAIAQWGRLCEQGLKRYIDATRSLQESALKSQSEFVEAAGRLLASGNKLLAENLEQMTRDMRDSASIAAKPSASAAPQAVTHSHKRAA